MWDYDKLFAEGNVVGIKILNSNRLYNYIVDNRNIANNSFWSYYKNDTLSDKDDSNFEIQYIIRLDEHGNVVEKLFDRERDMKPEPEPMPELKTGMFVRVEDEGLGYVDTRNNRIVYQHGGYDVLDVDKYLLLDLHIYCVNQAKKYVIPKIIEVYSKNACAFSYCNEDVLIWRSPEYQAYLDLKYK